MAQLVERNELGKLPGTPNGDPVQPDGPLKVVGGAEEYPLHSVGFREQGPYVDINDSILGVHIYLSRNTVWDAAKLFDFVEPEKHVEVLEENAALAADVERLTAELDEARASQFKVVRVDELNASSVVTAPVTTFVTATNTGSGK